MASIYKRGNAWWGRVQRKGREHRQSLKTTNRRVAEKRLRDWLERLDAIEWGDKPRRSFDEAMHDFLVKHGPTLKTSSYKRYISSARVLLFFEGKHLDEINGAALAEFEAERRSHGTSPPTIRRDLACLSSMFSFEIENERWTLNPVPSFLKARRRRGSLKPAPPTKTISDAQGRERVIGRLQSQASRLRRLRYRYRLKEGRTGLA